MLISRDIMDRISISIIKIKCRGFLFLPIHYMSYKRRHPWKADSKTPVVCTGKVKLFGESGAGRGSSRDSNSGHSGVKTMSTCDRPYGDQEKMLPRNGNSLLDGYVGRKSHHLLPPTRILLVAARVLTIAASPSGIGRIHRLI